MWDSNEAYDDIREITGPGTGMFDRPAWTALNNANLKSCNGAADCDGKLVNKILDPFL